MEPHVERLSEELKELKFKNDKLVLFIEKDPVFAGLSDEDQFLLHQQNFVMMAYMLVLIRRLALAGQLTLTYLDYDWSLNDRATATSADGPPLPPPESVP